MIQTPSGNLVLRFCFALNLQGATNRRKLKKLREILVAQLAMEWEEIVAVHGNIVSSELLLPFAR